MTPVVCMDPPANLTSLTAVALASSYALGAGNCSILIDRSLSSNSESSEGEN